MDSVLAVAIIRFLLLMLNGRNEAEKPGKSLCLISILCSTFPFWAQFFESFAFKSSIGVVVQYLEKQV